MGVLRRFLSQFNKRADIPPPAVSTEAEAAERAPALVDWGHIAATTPLTQQLEVEVSQPANVEYSLFGLEVQPASLAAPGRHTLTLQLDPDKLIPGSLIEGTLTVHAGSAHHVIRLTGSVDESAFVEHKSSVVPGTPWALLHTLPGHQVKARCAAFTADGQSLISGGDDCMVRRWEMATGKELWEPVKYASEVRSICASRVSCLLAVGLRDGTVCVEDAVTGRQVWSRRLHQGFVSSLAFTPNSTVLVSGGGDRAICVCDASSGEHLYQPIQRRTIVTSVAISGNGLVLASTSQDRLISLWEIRTGALLRELKEHQANVWTVAFSLDGHTLASGSNDKTVCLWDASSGKLIGKLDGFSRDIYSVAVSPDGKLVVTASGEPKIRIWDAQTLSRLANVETGQVIAKQLVFSPEQSFLAAVLDDGPLFVWTVR
jgi:WD40 repeat protein